MIWKCNSGKTDFANVVEIHVVVSAFALGNQCPDFSSELHGHVISPY
ncbi:MAG: hypothetical protein IIC60_02445 [Proteobacteria bacterium]|nr:hypothetical protein [Pseudomonadota bacterium]